MVLGIIGIGMFMFLVIVLTAARVEASVIFSTSLIVFFFWNINFILFFEISLLFKFRGLNIFK